jgi:hypothetical protein
MSGQSFDERLHDLEKMVDGQSSNGTWNCNPYMWGLANGLILALHTMRGEKGEVPYKHKPDEWLDDCYARLKREGWKPESVECEVSKG